MESGIVGGGVHTAIYKRKAASPSNIVLLVFPGNPGVIDFYVPFIDSLYQNLNQKYDVIGIGHAGHGLPAKNADRIFTLEEQIQHKIHYIESSFDLSTTKFILLGHSVGSYIALKVTQRRKDFNVIQVVNLFPTFRHLYEGLTPVKKLLVQPLVTSLACSFVYWTPMWVKNRLMRLSSELVDEAHYLVVQTNLIDYYILKNILSMAYIETLEICEIDEEVQSVISDNLSKMYFLYGPKDKYAPKSYWEDLHKSFPGVNAHLADELIPHAFVTSHPKEVALHINPWIEEVLKGHL
eukprot:TRINITY_DN9920_c0_g1_i1.p1 TRINITY_DN9920_c0_g1~~TRINITY_DN9920_c0_g1_i1.p1  ORF type:complete len:294 (-),score=57.50 TRINITY_DN9920_c0_g1_i1:28-909(-)